MNTEELRKIQLVLIFTFIVLAVFLNLWSFQPSSGVTGMPIYDSGWDFGEWLNPDSDTTTDSSLTSPSSGDLTIAPSPTLPTGDPTAPAAGDGTSICLSAPITSDITSLLGVENCCNNGDDDGDGKTDCADPDCNGKIGKIPEMSIHYLYCQQPETSCSDNFDNDRDGCKDALDSSCGGTELSAGTDYCGDNKDNDCDKKTDCADSDCTGSSFCQTAEICNNGQDEDKDGFIDCKDADCNDKQGNGGICQQPKELSCQDSFDNDGDTYVDCTDSDCAGKEGCGEDFYSCSDGVDNDNDFRKDCRDPDCNGEIGPDGGICQYPDELSCSDGKDNDGDGQVDCDDYWSCKDKCPELRCSDRIDNDGDGKADCCDTDCSGKAQCTSDNTCSSDSDCGGYKCNCGYCAVECDYNQAPDCNSGYECKSTKCIKLDCTIDAQCIPYKCVNNACSFNCQWDSSNCYNTSYICAGTDCVLANVAAVIGKLDYPVYPTGFSIEFDGSGSQPEGAINTYKWEFGDKASSDKGLVQHAFSNVGDYTVKLTVIDVDGNTDTASMDVKIDNGPVPIISSPKKDSYATGEQVILEHASYHLAGTIVKVEWDIGRKKYPWGAIESYADSLACRSLTNKQEQCLSGYVYDSNKALKQPCLCIDNLGKIGTIYKYSYINTTKIDESFAVTYTSPDDCKYEDIVKEDKDACLVTLTLTDSTGETRSTTETFVLTGEAIASSGGNESNATQATPEQTCRQDHDAYSHPCVTGEEDIIYQSSTITCCCDKDYNIVKTIGGQKCAPRSTRTITDAGSIGTNLWGEITDIDGEDVTDYEYDESGFSYWWIIILIVSVVVVIILYYLYQGGYLDSILKRKKKPGSAGKPTTGPNIPKTMPPTRPGSPLPTKTQQKPKAYSDHFKKSLSELAKKYRRPTQAKPGTPVKKPVTGAVRPNSMRPTTRPTTRAVTRPTTQQRLAARPLQKPLQRLARPQIKPAVKKKPLPTAS